MKKSKVETAQTRKRIIEVAAKAFKSNGIEATGVAEVMSAAGMTHGGFYRHFESKEQLVAEVCATSLELMIAAAQAAAQGSDAAFLKHLQSFVSQEFRPEQLGACPMVAMGSELARADVETRRTVAQGYRRLFDIIAERSGKDAKAARDDAVFTLSTLIGAVTMARVMDDPEVSEHILAVARKRLGEISAVGQKKPTKSKAA